MASKKAKNAESVWDVIDRAEKATDRESLQKLHDELQAMLEEGFKPAEKAPGPYVPALEMTEAFRAKRLPDQPGGLAGAVEAGFAGAIGDLAIDTANAISGARRRVAYRLKTLFGFEGMRLVEEGDSWTQYPIRLEDIVDQLEENDDIAIYSVGAAGDLVSKMAAEKQYLNALEETGAAGMILSGGGNDFFGDFEKILVDHTPGVDPADLIDETAFGPVFEEVMAGYETILSDVARDHPGVIVFGHGYDLPYPEADGDWIGPALAAKGVPLETGRDVLQVVMDRFNRALADLASAHGNFVVSDLRGRVDKGPNSWFDELHPKNAGYARAAAIIEESIRSRFSGGPELAVTAPAGLEATAASIKKVIVLDPGHGGTEDAGGSSWNNATGPKGTLEKTLTLDVAKRTRDILEARGFTVLITRDSDVNLSLTGRAAVAKNANAATFVSIHFNASDRHNAQGTETFVHSSIPKSADHASKDLCLAVQAEMAAALGLRDRNALHPGGIKYGGFGVINPNNHAGQTAAVLHEVSFLDRADEEARLAKVSYRRTIATALADGIEAYLDDAFPSATGLELGDAIELAAHQDGVSTESYLTAFATSRAAGPASVPESAASVGGQDDVSNGHMIGGASGGEDDAFLWALAQSEAGFAQAAAVGGGVENAAFSNDEGSELFDYDPAVERAFGHMSANLEANLGALNRLFAVGAAPRAAGFDHDAFIDFINGLGLRYFSPGEFLVLGGNHGPGGKGEGLNTFPPRALWPNIANTAKLLDEFRDRLGSPIFVSSAYRSPAYNRAIKGSENSQHLKFSALDWAASSGSVSGWRQIARAVRSENRSLKVGIGYYPGTRPGSSKFIHVDTGFRERDWVG